MHMFSHRCVLFQELRKHIVGTRSITVHDTLWDLEIAEQEALCGRCPRRGYQGTGSESLAIIVKITEDDIPYLDRDFRGLVLDVCDGVN